MKHTYKNVKPSSDKGPARQTHGFGAAVGGSEAEYSDGTDGVSFKGPKKLAKGGSVMSRGVAKRGFGVEVK